jgi:hypothetical protein
LNGERLFSRRFVSASKRESGRARLHEELGRILSV